MSYVSEALEQKLAAFIYLTEAYENPRLRPGVTPAERVQWKTDMHCLVRAEPFFWNSRTVEIVSSTMGDFKLDDITCTRSILYNDCAWHWFSGKGPFEIEDWKTKEKRPVRAISWYWFNVHSEPYLGATAWTPSGTYKDTGEPGGPLVPTLWACVDGGTPMSTCVKGERLNLQGYTDERTEWEIRQLKHFVICASTFLRQELLIIQREKVERHARKRIKKSGLPTCSEIQVVQLRRTHKTPGISTESGEKVDWQWQWTVKGHVRQQYYATLDETLPIYIHPYVKGPEDKPLKPRTTPIFSVTR